MTNLDTIKMQVENLPKEDKQELRYYINQSLRESSLAMFKKREGMRQIQMALRGTVQF